MLSPALRWGVQKRQPGQSSGHLLFSRFYASNPAAPCLQLDTILGHWQGSGQGVTMADLRRLAKRQEPLQARTPGEKKKP